MEGELSYTLLADGPSDGALTRIIDWLLEDIAPGLTPIPEFADLRGMPRAPRDLGARITTALQLFPCEVLFVHRDAENQPPDTRRLEIQTAADQVGFVGKHVPIVPVRMTEAWLLTDIQAIRTAAGNPNGTTPLQLPAVASLEELSDPKQTLRELVSQAAATTTRRSYRERELHTAATTKRIADLTASFAALAGLSAFARLREDVAEALAGLDADV